MKITSYLFFTLIFFIHSMLAVADAKIVLPPADSPTWELHKEVGSIKVYIGDIEGSSFNGFKATANLQAPIENIIAVMSTPKSCLEWVENCKNSYGFEFTSFHHRYGYTSSHLPWPFKDRDLVVKIISSNNPQSGEIQVKMHAANGKVAETDDNQRIHIAETNYRFKKIDDNHTQVTWLQHADPTGSLPSWLVNALIVDIPLKSLQKLEKVANLPKYSGYSLIYDANGILQDIQKPK